MTGRRPARGAGEAGHRAVCSTGSRPSPTAIPLPRAISTTCSAWRPTMQDLGAAAAPALHDGLRGARVLERPQV